ncbi:MAG: 5-oxoprolinase subunit PxpB [Anaerolineales bacterium]|nr:5-oxoprolinase subunit PxpB [Chloroflexota bacterium]MCC6985825.1 5-oxoprolinase subunit PxpB [Anaerolineales bacterium]
MLKPLGDSSILVQLGDEIDSALNQRVHTLDALLQSIPTVIETVPAYCTVLVHYDPLITTYNQIKNRIEEKISQLDESTHRPSRRLEIPVLYGNASGLDASTLLSTSFDLVAATLGLSPSELIRLHSEREYTIYMMGFTPGFPYMGILNEKLTLPRLSTPQTRVPAGSVAIAGSQTGIYPVDSPGGWHILGHTPLKLFDPASETPFLFSPGDIVKFIPTN